MASVDLVGRLQEAAEGPDPVSREGVLAGEPSESETEVTQQADEVRAVRGARFSSAAWFTKNIWRFPRALALLKTTEENRADLAKFTRQAASWAILMVGSLCALAAAFIGLAD